MVQVGTVSYKQQLSPTNSSYLLQTTLPVLMCVSPSLCVWGGGDVYHVFSWCVNALLFKCLEIEKSLFFSQSYFCQSPFSLSQKVCGGMLHSRECMKIPFRSWQRKGLAKGSWWWTGETTLESLRYGREQWGERKRERRGSAGSQLSAASVEMFLYPIRRTVCAGLL